MRVAFVSFDFGEYCVRLASALAEDAEVQLLLPEHEVAPYLYMLSPAVRLETFVKPRLRHAVRQVRTVASLVRDIHRLAPDVIHLQAGHLWFNCALHLLRRYPLVLTVHDPYKHYGDSGAQNTPQWVVDFGCRRATRLIVHAPQLKQALLERLPIPAGRVHVVPHVLCGDDAAEPDIPEDDHLILFFGRIWPYKGLEYLIRAEPLITARVPEARIVIAGTGEKLDRYRTMMVHPDHFVIHNDYVSDGRRAQLFRRASVVVLPYVEASQSGVIPVAYRYKKPVVATAVGGLPAFVDHGQTGFLVPPRDHESLADAIVCLLENKDLRRRLGANAKHKIDTECSPDVIARKTMRVYEEAVGSAHRASRKSRR